MSGERAKNRRAKGSGSKAEPKARPRRRPRTEQLPPVPEDRTLDYAACRPELAGIDPGETVLAIEELEGFHHLVRPVLADIDRRRHAPLPGERKRRGRAPSFHAIDYWRLELLRRVVGKHSTKDTRDWLTMDRARPTRELLGFDQPRRHHGGKERVLAVGSGIPCEGWMSDFRTKWLPEAELARLLQQLQRWALAEKVMTVPGVREELNLLFADGSKLETHGTPPHWKKQGKDKHGNERPPKLLNPDSITAPDAGYIPRTLSGDHWGAGWNILFVMGSRGTVLGNRNVPLHVSESETLAGMSDELKDTLDWLDAPGLRVLTADTAFHADETRRKLREAGIVENIHLSSHGKAERSRKLARKRDLTRWPFQGYNWHTNGHRELACDCGKGKVAREFVLDRHGKAVTRVKGECKNCGSITVTSGWWRLAKNPYHWVKVGEHDRGKAAMELGNALTFNDKQAKSYGVPRFPSQEGVFGSQFATRFNLIRGKRWFYRQSQVDLEVAAVVTITHALSIERHRRQEAGAHAGGPAISGGSVTALRPPGQPPPLAEAA